MLSRLAYRYCASAASRLAHTSSNTSQAAAVAAAAPTTPAVDGERNLVDFPRPVRPIDPPPVRMGFIPQTWFDLLYNKTGVTGPYMLGTGLITFLVSKEIYVIEHEFYGGVPILCLVVIAMKKLGPMIIAAAEEEIENSKKEMDAGRTNAITELNNHLSNLELGIEQSKGQTVLFEAKKENIALQLEAAYRARLQKVHVEVKKRLDYQLETSNVFSRFEQKHMVNWIVENVRKSITPAQEAATIKQCITDLKGLAARVA